MLFIYYPKCSTCQKALKHLKRKNLNPKLRHIVEDTPTQEELLKWIDVYGEGIKPFFNTSGKLYRELDIKNRITKMTNEEAALLLSQNGMLIKRPLLIQDDDVIIGYKEGIYENL